MLFNSSIFIFIFLPITFGVYFYLYQREWYKTRQIFLVFSSLFFYSWWNIAYLPILITSIAINYTIGYALNTRYIVHNSKKKLILSVGVIFNIGLLAYFKYMDFFIENYNVVFDKYIEGLHIALPLAISFFTFQQIAYLVDSYKGECAKYDFLTYANFVTFFPQLIAGPIVHHSEMIPQFMKNRGIHYANVAAGLFLFSMGLFKKVAIADTFSVYANAGFDKYEILNFFDAWATSLSYTFQLYFDFSGYTDMALGIALLFNIKLPMNFFSPYKAKNIQDFWQRWHMTLSRFLKEYIYIPLGGNRKGKIRTYVNLFITFLIAGVWHGAGWTFIFWGMLHGIALIVHRIWKLVGFKLPSIVAWFLTFNFLNISWVFFRAKEWDDALKILRSMFDISSVHISLEALKNPNISFIQTDIRFFTDSMTWMFLVLGFVVVLFFKNSNQLLDIFKSKTDVSAIKLLMITMLLGISLILVTSQSSSEFLYFNF